MKKKGSKFEYEAQRDKELSNAFRTAMVRCAVIRKTNIYKTVAAMPCSRFWVSEERASIVISRMMQGDTLDNMRPLKQEMFQEIYRRVMELHQERPEDSVYDLVWDAVHQPAPKFYLTPGSVKTILIRIRKRERLDHRWFGHHKHRR